MNEFELIKKYFQKISNNNPSAKKLNDDVFFDRKNKLVVSIDTYNEGIHFKNFKHPNLVIKKIVEETPNDMELGEKIREMYWKNRELQKQYINMKGWIYESPDGGKTITRRKMGEDISERELVKDLSQLNLFENE